MGHEVCPTLAQPPAAGPRAVRPAGAPFLYRPAAGDRGAGAYPGDAGRRRLRGRRLPRAGRGARVRRRSGGTGRGRLPLRRAGRGAPPRALILLVRHAHQRRGPRRLRPGGGHVLRRRERVIQMAHASARELDLRTAAPFGISRWTHSEFADYVVELRAGEHVGRGEAAPNRRYGESREEGLSLIHISEPTRLGMISYAGFW